MSAQILFPALLYLAGVSAGALFRKRLPFPFICASGFLWGALIWILVGLVGIILWLPPKVCAGIFLLILLGLLAVNLGINKSGLGRKEIAAFAGYFSAFCLVLVLCEPFNLSVASYDSFKLILLGRARVADNSVSGEVLSSLASWGSALPLLHSAAVILSVDYLHAIQPAFGFSLLTSFGYLLLRAARHAWPASRWAGVLVGLACAAMMSTYFMIFQCFYIHNSLPAAAYLLVSVAAMWLALAEFNWTWLVCAVAALIGFSLMRMEGPLFGAIFLGLLVSNQSIPYRIRMRCAVAYGAFMATWYLYLLYSIGAGVDILTPSRAVVIVGLMFALVLLAGASRFQRLAGLMRFVPMLILAGLSTALVFAVVKAPDPMSQSVIAIAQNMTAYGRWGWTWIILVVLLVLVWTQPGLGHDHLFSVGIPAFFLLLSALAYLRVNIPYRLGFGDSANRILTHILPITMFYLTLRYGRGIFCSAAVGASAGGRVAGGAVGVGLLVATIIMSACDPKDFADGAEVLEQPQCCRRDKQGKHDMSVALRGKTDHRYVAAAQPGPAVAVIRLKRPAQAAVIDLVQYHETEAFEDYGLYVSIDGQAWSPIYDSHNVETQAPRQIARATLRFTLPNDMAFRFVRLEFRSSKGQNRFLLKRLAIYEHEPESRGGGTH